MLWSTLRGGLPAAAAALALAATGSGAWAQAKCQLQAVADLKVLNDKGAPTVAVSIDGKPVSMIVDTGSARTALLTPAAQALGLVLGAGPSGLRMYGVGGETRVYQATVSRFDLGGASVTNLRLLVMGEHDIPGEAGLLGWDLLSHWDVEFDLAHHAIRLLRPSGCHGDAVVYWSPSYYRTAIEPMTGEHVDIDLQTSLNHHAVEATLDSGAASSVLTPGAAQRAGVKAAGRPEGQSFGLGSTPAAISVVRLDTFELGGETVQNARLQLGDLFARSTYQETGSILNHRLDNAPEMLLGADFLRAHRVLIAPDQNMLYFTYEGGPVFAPGEATTKTR